MRHAQVTTMVVVPGFRHGKLPTGSRSRTSHDCQLPVHATMGVSLDPRTKRRATPGLLVKCALCKARWTARIPWSMAASDDVFWSELGWLRRAWTRHQVFVDFESEAYYRLLDPHAIDWRANPRALRPDGLPYLPVQFPELRGAGEYMCEATTHAEGGTVDSRGIPIFTVRCILRPGHENQMDHNGYTHNQRVWAWPVE